MGRGPQKLELTWFNKDKALIPTEKGKYGYTWVHPKDPRYFETHTLLIDEVVRGEQSLKEDGVTYSERADLEPTEDNLLIRGESGDVLEALTQVPELADKYVGQVKCIYIDPPFNTAQTFANYEDNLEHSIWLTMMRDRLVHLRKLLSEHGSIWVHLDDVENHRMRVLMDEVFGAGNFISTIVWQKRYSRESRPAIGEAHDSIVVYSKNPLRWKHVRNKVPRATAKEYKNPNDDPRGPWRIVPMTAPGTRANQQYPIEGPDGTIHYPPRGRCWSTVESGYQELLAQGRIRFGTTGKGSPGILRYLSEDEGLTPWTWWPQTEVGHNDEAKRELMEMFLEDEAFSTPKPERLLERVIHIATNPGDIVIDVFAGSGTTAAVAQKMGRRWVTCELVSDTMNRFTRPRLEKVVRGEDPGGVTQTKGERVDGAEDGLPEGLSAEEAQKLTSLLNKAIVGQDDLKKDAVIKRVKDLVKTKKSPDTLNWRGGGGFTVARLSPTCFDYDPDLDLVTLTDVAIGAVLIESVAANLNFRLTPEHRTYHGIRGAMWLAVVEGRLDQSKVDDLLAHLDNGDGLTIAATEIDDGVRQYLRSVNRGCRAVHIPNDIFTYSAAEEN